MRIAKRCETICIGMVLCFCLAGCSNERVTNDKLIYHNIKTDAKGKIIPEELSRSKCVIIDATKRFQVIDGFGVNITPRSGATAT